MILVDVVEEAIRLTDAARDANVPLRVMGGVAVAIHSEGQLPPSLVRNYGDIDLVTVDKGAPEAIQFLKEMGYVSHERFNALNARRRLIVYDLGNERQVDVFVGEFAMCHRIPIANRLELDHRTIPLAELLVTKMQIVQLNRKDLVDMFGILTTHDVGDSDAEMVNAGWIARLLAKDWGLWRTSKNTVDAMHAIIPTIGLPPSDQAIVEDRLRRLWERVERQPKSIRWRSRARVGERVRWYEDPEEIAHAAGRAAASEETQRGPDDAPGRNTKAAN